MRGKNIDSLLSRTDTRKKLIIATRRHGDTAARGAGFSVQLAQNYNKNIVGVAGLIAEFLPGPNLHECKAVGVIIQHNCGPAPSYCWSSHNEMVELVLN